LPFGRSFVIILAQTVTSGDEEPLALQHLSDNVYYLPGPSNVGLILADEHRALLVDSGVGSRSSRQLIRILQGQNRQLAAILNTHCHGDHVGGNADLVRRTGAQVYAPRHDSAAIEHPVWTTMCLFGGAEPLDELRTPRFAPQPCPVDVIVSEGVIEVAGVTVDVVSLPGHTGSHTGYIVNDVFFTGDIVAGEAELANAPISYAYSVTKRLESLRKLRGYHCEYYVLGHGQVEREIGELVERNIAQVEETLQLICRHLARGCLEANDLLRAVCTHYGIQIRLVKQYYYWYPILHSYLSHLSNSGQIRYEIRDQRLLWCGAERG